MVLDFDIICYQSHEAISNPFYIDNAVTAFEETVLHYSVKTHQYNIGDLFMSEAKNANIVIEIYHILHSVQSSGQSLIDDVISYYKLRQAKFSYNSQSNNFNI